MRKFDYAFLNNGLLPAKMVNLTASITSLKTMAGLRKEEFRQIFTELEAVAKVQSVKSSNAIEGIVTSDERIAAIVQQNSAPLNHKFYSPSEINRHVDWRCYIRHNRKEGKKPQSFCSGAFATSIQNTCIYAINPRQK